MAISLDVSVDKTFSVNASPETVFELLSDIPKSVSYFPYVNDLKDLGNDQYQWTMEEIGAAGFTHVVVYACEYDSDAANKTVTWTPVKGVGNALMSGSWRIEPEGTGSLVHFTTSGKLNELPVPKLMKGMAKGLVNAEFEKPINKYHARLKETLERA